MPGSTSIQSAISRKGGQSTAMASSHWRKFGITERQFAYLRRNGAFGPRLKELGSGVYVLAVVSPEDVTRIEQILIEYRALLDEFETRYERLTSGARWAELARLAEDVA